MSVRSVPGVDFSCPECGIRATHYIGHLLPAGADLKEELRDWFSDGRDTLCNCPSPPVPGTGPWWVVQCDGCESVATDLSTGQQMAAKDPQDIWNDIDPWEHTDEGDFFGECSYLPGPALSL